MLTLLHTKKTNHGKVVYLLNPFKTTFSKILQFGTIVLF